MIGSGLAQRPTIGRSDLWSGCGVLPTGLQLPRPGLFYTSFTLLEIGDHCGERSRLTSWTVTLPHLMHKWPWYTEQESNPRCAFAR